MATATRKRTARKASAPKVDAYQVITDQIIELLDSGVAPWHKPWNAETGMPLSMSTGRYYRGVNVFLLAMQSAVKGYASPWWGTYKQISERGGQVRKGEKATMIVFWKQILKLDESTGKNIAFWMVRTFNVFNAEQTEDPSVLGLPAPTEPKGLPEQIAECDAVVREYLAGGPSFEVGGDAAYYMPGVDHVQMPELATFIGSEEYYGTLFHELTHSTGHSSRLDRDGVANLPTGHRFGDALYSKEELVAEMGAAFLAGMTGIAAKTLPNSAAYLQSWIRVLRGDKKLLVGAAAQAQKAADLILGVTFEAATED